MVTIRPATDDDLPRCHAVWISTEGLDSVAAAVLPLHEHELRTGTLLVAEDAGAGVVGFGATLTRSGVTYLADLFVAPDDQGHGIGRALLHALLDHADGPRFTMASGSASARALYERFGMAPSWEVSYVIGDAATLDVASLDAEGIEAQPTTVAAIAALDRAVVRRDRRPELQYESERLGGTHLLLTRGVDVIGHATVVQPTWWVPWRTNGTRVAPVVVRAAGDARAATAAAVRYAVAHGAEIINSSVPVPHPAHAALLDAGFRRIDADLHMTSLDRLVDPTRYLPSIDTV